MSRTQTKIESLALDMASEAELRTELAKTTGTPRGLEVQTILTDRARFLAVQAARDLNKAIEDWHNKRTPICH